MSNYIKPLMPLKLCPFCGATPDLIETYEGFNEKVAELTMGYIIRCPGCGIAICRKEIIKMRNGNPKIEINGYTNVISAWNKRCNNVEARQN